MSPVCTWMFLPSGDHDRRRSSPRNIAMSSSQRSVGGATVSVDTSRAGDARVCAAKRATTRTRVMIGSSLALRHRRPEERVLLASGLPHPGELCAVGRPGGQDRVLHARDGLLALVLIEQHQVAGLAIGVRDGAAAGRPPTEHQSGNRNLVDELADDLTEKYQSRVVLVLALGGFLDVHSYTRANTGRSGRRLAWTAGAGADFHLLRFLLEVDHQRTDAGREPIGFDAPVVERPLGNG